MEKYTVAELPLDEQNVLEQLYGGQMNENQGYSPNHILYVRELTTAEEGLFTNCTSFQPLGWCKICTKSGADCCRRISIGHCIKWWKNVTPCA